MTDSGYLAYLPDPFGVLRPLFCILTDQGEVKSLAAGELSNYAGLVITYDVPTLVDNLRQLGLAPPAQIADIGQALRMLVGQPKNEAGEGRWNAWRYLARFFRSETDAQNFIAIAQSKKERLPAADMQALLETAASALRSSWINLTQDLKDMGELARFRDVEIPVQSIFAQRQFMGLAIDVPKVQLFLKDVAQRKYEGYRRVASALNASPTSLTFWNISDHLEHTDAKHLAGQSNGGRLREAFKLAASASSFAAAFLQFSDSSRDEITLHRSNGPDGRLFPIFDTFGTVSGRILVSDPGLQQLRRTYRSIITADAGRSLIYLDYAQFEPGILAYLSQDEGLIAAYNAGDLYTALSVKVFGSENSRPLAKRIFLAFCYGMSIDALVNILSGPQAGAETRDGFKSAIEDFFSAFEGLTSFRDQSAVRLESAGVASSLMGNGRRRSRTGPLTNKERRWALNQPVQSTASLIFKEAIIELSKVFGADAILLPMHDAVLMQFPGDAVSKEDIASAVSIMETTFVRWCPNIKVRVTSGNFSE